MLATTSPYDLVAPFAGQIGLDDVIATRYGTDADGRYDGTIDGHFVSGQAVRRAGVGRGPHAAGPARAGAVCPLRHRRHRQDPVVGQLATAMGGIRVERGPYPPGYQGDPESELERRPGRDT